MKKNYTESDFVKAAVRGELHADCRLKQTEEGSWLAHWHGVPGDTPPIEKRQWYCSECWDRVNKKFGEAKTNRIFVVERIIFVVERIKDIDELPLKSGIFCVGCTKDLTKSSEAYVEVY